VSLTPLFRILKKVMKKPRPTSVAGLVALLLACSYLYLLSAHVSRGTAEPVASWAVSVRQPSAASSPETNATSTPSATPSTPAYTVYTVQPGDTLGGIARRFSTTVEAIMELNNLTGDLINIGQELVIPGTRQISTPLPTSTPKNTPPGSTPSSIPAATFSPTPTSTSSPPTATSQPTIAPPGAPSSGEPLVVAFYYAWYGLDEWTRSRVPDIPAVPYESRDRSTIIRHVEQAQGAGIDAFVVAWYGPQTRNNQTETNFRTVLEVASQRCFRATVDFETRSSFFHSQTECIHRTGAISH